MRDQSELEQIIGYSFRDASLLTLALSHRSIDGANNERLEFLGDSVLGLIITNHIFKNSKNIDEGDLSKLRSAVVCGKALAGVATKLSLGNYLILGTGERKSGGYLRESILGDTVEALIGAIFLDSNIDITHKCIMEWFNPLIRDALSRKNKKDSKTRLQEWLQKRGHAPPTYNLSSTEGSPHSKIFFIECVLDEFEITGRDKASSRKAAEQLVASKILKELGI